MIVVIKWYSFGIVLIYAIVKLIKMFKADDTKDIINNFVIILLLIPLLVHLYYR